MEYISKDSISPLAPDGRPIYIVLYNQVPCCGSKLIIQCDCVYKCPCGNRQERAAKKALSEKE